MTMLRTIKFIFKLLLFIIISPVLMLLVLFRSWYYRKALVRNMMQSGMPKEYAKQLGKETKLKNLIR